MKTTRLRFAENEPQTQKERKATLREYAKKRRAENVNRDMKEERLIENFYKAVFEKTGGAGMKLSFFIYLSFFLEAPTDGLIERLLRDGHKVYCPRMENGELVAVEYGGEMTLSSYGIREPEGPSYDGKIDIAVVPFLAVDKQGNRVGYGGGYYDRYLKRSPATRVAYGYDFQVVSVVPCEEWDEKMHLIVTDERIYYTQAK